MHAYYIAGRSTVSAAGPLTLYRRWLLSLCLRALTGAAPDPVLPRERASARASGEVAPAMRALTLDLQLEE